MTDYQPRSGQSQVLSYTGGRMGISAVPGSGKTRTLAELAAQLVAQAVADGQEVLVVTLVNSAVDNFKQRINQSIKKRGLLTGFGYRVRTLHGLAHDIVRERPGLVGLSEDFGIIDEREADSIREDVVEAWLRSHPEMAENYLSPSLAEREVGWVKRTQWPALVRDLASSFIKRAKDRSLTPEALSERLGQQATSLASPIEPWLLALAQMGAALYRDYQQSLAYRGVVDFDDLIRLALETLSSDPEYLARLRSRWPYILEDEAQDSSELQESILSLLSGDEGNWVRVGDPNQAIYESFTNADPRFLRRYLEAPGVTAITMDESGRSQGAVIGLANHLVDWATCCHPTAAAREAFVQQQIRPTPPGDPQPNPPTDLNAVRLVGQRLTPDQELQVVTESLERWLRDHPDSTVAVLAPRNQRGFEVIDRLKGRGIAHVELLRSTDTTRRTAGALGNVLRCLVDPLSARRLSVAFRVWLREEEASPGTTSATVSVAEQIKRCPAVEAYLWPRADHDWLASLLPQPAGEELALLTAFRPVACRWHRAAVLPVDQLVLMLAGDLFRQPAELALSYKLALLLRDVAESHPSYRLAELVEEMALIARNERRFLGFASEESGFEPPAGAATVATMHKAKGLEWDRVYLMSLNNYDFPSGLAHDTYIAEHWFVRDGLNLEAEVLALLDLFAEGVEASTVPLAPGQATLDARLKYIDERLRLLYVGLTRAKRDLIATWNTGRSRRGELQAAVPFVALQEYWHQQVAGQ